MAYEVITFRGEKEEWDKFVDKCRKDKRKVWDIMKPLLRDYSKDDSRLRRFLGL